MKDWNELRNTMERMANNALRRTGELADMTAMGMKLKKLEGQRDEQYRVLGKLTYRQLKTGVSQAEKIADTIDALDEVRQRIRVLRDDMERVKAERAARLAAEEPEEETEPLTEEPEEPEETEEA